MLQLAGIVVGIIAILMVAAALKKGEIAFTRGKPLTGNEAKIAGALTIAIGIALITFSIFGIPLVPGD